MLKIVASKASRIGTRTIRLDDAAGVTLCLLAIIIYTAGSGTLYTLEYHILTLPLFLAGGTLVLFDFATLRHVFVAILLTLYIQPPPGQLVSELAADLSWTSAVIVEALLASVGVPISLDTSFGAPALIIMLDNDHKIPFFVGEPSSGVFSTIGLSLFAVFVAYIIRGKMWKRMALFASGFPVFYMLNTLRIAIVISLWYLWGQEISEAYHLVSGSLMVAFGTFLILIMGEKIFKLKIGKQEIKTSRCSICEKCSQLREPFCFICGRLLSNLKHPFGRSTVERSAVLVFILLLGIAVNMENNSPSITKSTRLSDLDISTIEGPETTEYFVPAIDGWDQVYAYRDQRIESILNQDAALAYRYIPNADFITLSDGTSVPTNSENRFSVYTSIQISTGHHIWEDSLVTHPSRIGRPAATILESDNVDISDDKQGRFLMFKRVGSEATEAVFYWFERVPLKFGSQFESRNVLISIWANTDALTKSGILQRPDDSENIKKLYFSLSAPIADYWQQQSTTLNGSELLYTFVSQNALVILMLVIIPLAAYSVYFIRNKSISSSRKFKAYQRLDIADRSFLDTLLPTLNGSRHVFGHTIAINYQQVSGQRLSDDQLLERLKMARNSGLVNDIVISVKDEPHLVWKAAFRYDNKSGASWVTKIKTPVSIFQRIRLW
ncbi:MAG: exosortase/archaeosortase family protein [Candidatus Nitrosomirales archaeon]|jgi:exosortase/archaeosortase family protein